MKPRVKTPPGVIRVNHQNPRGCVKKQKYRSRKLAKQTLKERRWKNAHPYFCRICGWWHVGHRPSTDSEAEKAS